MEQKDQVVLYQTEDGETSVEVSNNRETVWLTQQQMTKLFETTKQNVSLHVSNIFKERELDENSTVKESLTANLSN